MFAFSPDRKTVHMQNTLTSDGVRRPVRTGVSQPGSHRVPSAMPATEPTEPSHERAVPQADGEP